LQCIPKHELKPVTYSTYQEVQIFWLCQSDHENRQKHQYSNFKNIRMKGDEQLI